jgi:hypothetical protein
MSTRNNILTPKPTFYEEIVPYLVDILKNAPKYGYCGIEIVFHDGFPVKIEKRCGVTLKTKPPHPPAEGKRG